MRPDNRSCTHVRSRQSRASLASVGAQHAQHAIAPLSRDTPDRHLVLRHFDAALARSSMLPVQAGGLFLELPASAPAIPRSHPVQQTSASAHSAASLLAQASTVACLPTSETSELLPGPTHPRRLLRPRSTSLRQSNTKSAFFLHGALSPADQVSGTYPSRLAPNSVFMPLQPPLFPRCFDDRLNPPNMCRFGIPPASLSRASNPRLVALVTATTTRSLRPSMACSRQS
jgi:hypothetical protein